MIIEVGVLNVMIPRVKDSFEEEVYYTKLIKLEHEGKLWTSECLFLPIGSTA
jgi:hypothetical protein